MPAVTSSWHDSDRKLVARKINRESVVLLGWGRAILCQLAHPLVATALADHSQFRQAPRAYLQRARGTVESMLALTFGTEAEVQAAAARIREIHSRVNGSLPKAAGVFPAGTRYSANDPDLLQWVYATLLDSLPLAYERLVGPLEEGEWDRYCREAAETAPLLELPASLVPQDTQALAKYMEGMLSGGEIVVTDTARELAEAFLSPPIGLAAPFYRLARVITIGLLPSSIREGYGFRWGPREERSFARALRVVRGARAILPRIAREWPAARRIPHG